MSDFRPYLRKQVVELRPWSPDFDMARVSISLADKEAGSPKAGDMIARNPKSPHDQWLVAEAYFHDNYESAPMSEQGDGLVTRPIFNGMRLEPLKVWIESDLEPRWFGLWHRRVYYVRTDFMRHPFYDRGEAEETAAFLREHL